MVKHLPTPNPAGIALLKKLIFAFIAIGFGVLISVAANHSSASLESLMSVLLMALFMLIALYHPLGGFLCWIFLHTFIDSWVELEFSRGIPDFSFGRFAAFVLLLSLFMRVSTGRMRLSSLTATDFFAVLSPAAIVISAPLAAQPTATIQTALSLYFIPLAAYFLAKQLIRTQAHLNLFFTVVVCFGAVAGASALLEGLTGNVFFLAKGQVIDRLHRGETNLRLIEGLVGETGAMGRVLAITLLITLYMIVESKNSYFKPYWIVAALLQFGGLVITFSRTPLLTFLAGLLLLQFVYPSLRRLLIILAIVVAGALAVNWQQIQGTTAAQERLSGFDNYNGRSSRWQAGLNMWLEQPIRGWGLGRYGELSGRFRADGSRQNVDAVENDYLLILVGAGLIGFLPYALFLFSNMTASMRLFVRRKSFGGDGQTGFLNTGTIVLFWGIMLGFLVGSFFAINAHAISRLLPFALMGAIVGSHQFLLARTPQRKWRLADYLSAERPLHTDMV